LPSLQTRAADVQAALTIVVRRPTEEDAPHLDLNQTDLRQGNLDKANLTEARLDGAISASAVCSIPSRSARMAASSRPALATAWVSSKQVSSWSRVWEDAFESVPS
jgi:hypothetical protein